MLLVQGKPSALTSKHKHMSKANSKCYFEDTSSNSSRTDNPSGNGSSSGESVFPNAPACAKRPWISTVTTQSSTRTTTPAVQTKGGPNSPSPALPAVQPSPSILDVDTSMPIDCVGILSVGTTTPTRSANLQPPNTPVDAMDVDDFPSRSTLCANMRAPSVTPAETEDTETKVEVIPTVITEAATATVPKVSAIGIEPVVGPAPIVDPPSITTMVTPPPTLSNIIDPRTVPAFLCNHGKGNCQVNIFKYLDKLQDPHFQQILSHYIIFEANNKSSAGGCQSTFLWSFFKLLFLNNPLSFHSIPLLLCPYKHTSRSNKTISSTAKEI